MELVSQIKRERMKTLLEQYGGSWSNGPYGSLHYVGSKGAMRKVTWSESGWAYWSEDGVEDLKSLADIRRVAQLSGTAGDTAVSIARNHLAPILFVLESLEEQGEQDSSTARMIARRMQKLSEELHTEQCSRCQERQAVPGYARLCDDCWEITKNESGLPDDPFSDEDIPY